MNKINDYEPRIGGERLHRLRNLALKFDVSEETVRSWIKKGRLEAFKIGGSFRVSDAQLARFLEGARGEVNVDA
jgi:excisionase family DNA binding protein